MYGPPEQLNARCGPEKMSEFLKFPCTNVTEKLLNKATTEIMEPYFIFLLRWSWKNMASLNGSLETLIRERERRVSKALLFIGNLWYLYVIKGWMKQSKFQSMWTSVCHLFDILYFIHKWRGATFFYKFKNVTSVYFSSIFKFINTLSFYFANNPFLVRHCQWYFPVCMQLQDGYEHALYSLENPCLNLLKV